MKKTLAGVSAALCAALCGVAFATGLPEQEFRDPSVANRPQTYRLDFGGGKTVSGTLAAREWRLVNPSHAYRNQKTTNRRGFSKRSTRLKTTTSNQSVRVGKL